MTQLDPSVARQLAKLFRLYKVDEDPDYLEALQGFSTPHQLNALTDYVDGHAPDHNSQWIAKPMQIKARCQHYQNYAIKAAQRRAELKAQLDERKRLEAPQQSEAERKTAADRILKKFHEDYAKRNQQEDRLGQAVDSTTPETFKRKKYAVSRELQKQVGKTIQDTPKASQESDDFVKAGD